MPACRPCAACGMLIYFSDRKMPTNASDDRPHWAVCTKPEAFRKPPSDERPRDPPPRQLELGD